MPLMVPAAAPARRWRRRIRCGVTLSWCIAPVLPVLLLSLLMPVVVESPALPLCGRRRCWSNSASAQDGTTAENCRGFHRYFRCRLMPAAARIVAEGEPDAPPWPGIRIPCDAANSRGGVLLLAGCFAGGIAGSITLGVSKILENMELGHNVMASANATG